jgi:hypothetical protein
MNESKQVVSRMFKWLKKNKNKHLRSENHDTPTNESFVTKTESIDESENNEPAVSPRQFWNAGTSVHDLVGEIYNEQLKNGAFDNLPGKGKPMEIPSGDITNSILKNANIIPDWLTLQHEIRDQLRNLLTFHNDDLKIIERELIEINKKIMSYNNKVPSTYLQKRKILRDNMEQQLQHWV